MTNDDMNGQDNNGEPETSESFEELTNRLKVGEAITLMEQVVEEPEPNGSTTRIKSYAFAKTSWKQRILNWFKR